MTAALEGVRSQQHAPAALYPRERTGTHFTGGWVAPEPVWTGAENLTPTGIRSLDRPGRSQSLYRLRYPPHVPQEWSRNIDVPSPTRCANRLFMYMCHLSCGKLCRIIEDRSYAVGSKLQVVLRGGGVSS